MVNPPSNVGPKWVLIAIDYFTRWTNATPLKEVTRWVILEFIEEIVTRFGVPQIIIYDNSKDFIESKISNWDFGLGIYLKNSSNYYPQGDGLTKYTNKKWS